MSDKATTLSSLQAIRAKLQQLQMQQPSARTTLQKTASHEPEASFSNSFDTPSSTQHTETELSKQNTIDSLHYPERGKAYSKPDYALSSGFSGKQASILQESPNRNNAMGLSQPSCRTGTGATASRTADVMDRSLSGSFHMKDSAPPCPRVGNEENISKVLGTSSKAADKAVSKLAHVGNWMEGNSHSSLEFKPHVPGILGRRTNQNTGDFEFKIPKRASGYPDYQMEIGPSAGNMSADDSLASDLPTFTHPPSASKHSLRHFNSTPDVRSSAKKPSSELKISSLNLGKPMRVRMQQHEVHKLSEEKDEDSDIMNSFKPFSVSTGRFASMASSGYQSDMTITTENSIPTQSSNSFLRQQKGSGGSGTATEYKATVVKPVESKNPGPLPGQLPAASVVAPPLQQGVGAVMSTPSCKGPYMAPAVLHTPSGEVMDSVVVNGEQYCVLKKVGRGGSAQVYMVLDASKNIRALKVVDLEGAGPEVVDGFRNEIRLLQRLQYCNSVIKMFNFELNETSNCLYVVLEFGETDLSGFFTARAKQGQGLDPLLIKFFWREMLRAVHALHKEGVIHSDLKPANFMLVAGNLKLIDFGIANTLQQDKTSVLKDSRVGTPSYMSPEAIMAACEDTADDDDSMDEKENHTRPKYKVGVRSDVWSLGCILYNMVYGRTPFQHIKNNMAKLQAITNPAVPIKFPDLSDLHLLDVLQKCLQREVKCRPTTAELLAHPYLLNGDKEGDKCRTPPPKVARKGPSASGSAAAPLESRRLQELLKSQLAQGSPGTASAVSRVVDMLQKLESSK